MGPCVSTVVGASAAADTLQGRFDDNTVFGWSKIFISVVLVAVSQEGGAVTPPRYSVLSGPHVPTTHAAHGYPRPCRADWASGLAGTLYEYTSILPAEGRGSGQYGYRRTFLIWEAGMGFPAAKPLHRRSQRLVHLASRRLCGPYGPMLFTLHSSLCTFSPFLDNYTVMDILPRTC